MRNASAKIHASGLEKHAPVKPRRGIRTRPAKDLAIISIRPAIIAKFENPIP